MSNRCSGTLAAWNDERGFGFIQPDDGGEDVFVVALDVERAGIGRPIATGTRLTYVVYSDNRGPKAANLEVIGRDPDFKRRPRPKPKPKPKAAPDTSTKAGQIEAAWAEHEERRPKCA